MSMVRSSPRPVIFGEMFRRFANAFLVSCASPPPRRQYGLSSPSIPSSNSTRNNPELSAKFPQIAQLRVSSTCPSWCLYRFFPQIPSTGARRPILGLFPPTYEPESREDMLTRFKPWHQWNRGQSGFLHSGIPNRSSENCPPAAPLLTAHFLGIHHPKSRC